MIAVKMTKEIKKTKETKEDLIKEVQRLSAAKHSKKELDKINEEDLKDIIQFKNSLKDVKSGRIYRK